MDITLITQLLDALGDASLLLIGGYVLKKVGDAILVRLIGDRLIDRVVRKATKRFKAFTTRFKKIKTDFEFTASIRDSPKISEAKGSVESTLKATQSFSKDNIHIERVNWIDEQTIEGKIRYLESDPLTVSIHLLQDNDSFSNPGVDTIEDANLSSISVSIRFEFPFHDLKGTLINLSTFAGFLRQGLNQEFDIRRFTHSRFIVGSLENDLTLDEWIEQERFEVSLLLRDESNERSVEFMGDCAIVTSPYSEIDDTTAEYIRATLLNYYL